MTLRQLWQLELVLKAIPTSWFGTIHTLYDFRCWDLLGLLGLFGVTLIHLIDGFGIGSGMKYNTETTPFTMKSNHWCRHCKRLEGEMRVCSNPTELITQILLAIVVAPRRRKLEKGSHEEAENLQHGKKVSFTKKVCEDCPEHVMPFRIKVYQNVIAITL